MDSNIKEWFGSGLKMKRWLFLVLIGTIILSFGIANIIALETMEFVDILSVGISFVLGAMFIVIGFIMAQRRILQAVAEANAGINHRNLNIKKLLFDKKMLDRSIKIVVVGGGTGLSSILKGLKFFSSNITAIVTTADDGTKKNQINKENPILPSADLRQSIVALSNKENVMQELMQYKYKEGVLKGCNFGDLLLMAMDDICDHNFAAAIQKTSDVLSITGKVLPVTLDRVNMGAVLMDGTRVLGEKSIPEKVVERESKIEKMFLSPERCIPAPNVIRSIKEADVIIIGPGSLYTGIIPNLLMKEVADEIRKSKATKIMVANIMSQPGQTDGYKVSDCINAIHEHAGKGVIDYCVANESDIMPEYIRRYNKEGADILEVDKSDVKATGVSLITDDLAMVDEKGYIRHDSMKLAKAVMKIICDNMDLASEKQALEYYVIRSKMKKMNRKNRKKKKSVLLKEVKIVMNSQEKKFFSRKKEYQDIPVVGQKNTKEK